MNKLFFSCLLLIISHSAWCETFELICDVKLEPVSQGRYRFDTETKTVAMIGSYSGADYSQNEPYEYKTIGWDLESGNLIWVADNHLNSDTPGTGPLNKSFDIIVFDFHNMLISFSRSSRQNGLIEHTIDFTESCQRDENE